MPAIDRSLSVCRHDWRQSVSSWSCSSRRKTRPSKGAPKPNGSPPSRRWSTAVATAGGCSKRGQSEGAVSSVGARSLTSL